MTSESEVERNLDDERYANTDIEKAFKHSTAIGTNRLTVAASGGQVALHGYGGLRNSRSIAHA
jgi:hypothetical protein